MKTVVYIVTCVVVLSVVSCTSRQKGGDDVQVLMQDFRSAAYAGFRYQSDHYL